MVFDRQHYTTGHAGMEGDTVRWYLSYLWNTTGPIMLLSLLAMVWGIGSRSREIMILSTFPLAYLLFISRFAVRNDRTLLPALAFLFILATLAVAQLFDRFTRQPSRVFGHASTAALTTLVLAVVMLMSAQTVRHSLRLSTVDSRETGRVWLSQNLPPGAKVALESYAPYVPRGRFSVQGFGRMIYNPPEWYVEQGFDYLVFSEGIYGRFYAEPAKYGTEIAQYDAFFDRFTLVQLFADGGLEVRVYRVTPQQSTLPTPREKAGPMRRPQQSQ